MKDNFNEHPLFVVSVVFVNCGVGFGVGKGKVLRRVSLHPDPVGFGELVILLGGNEWTKLRK